MIDNKIKRFILTDVTDTYNKFRHELNTMMEQKSFSKSLSWKDIKSFIEEEKEIMVTTCRSIEESNNDICVFKFTKNIIKNYKKESRINIMIKINKNTCFIT